MSKNIEKKSVLDINYRKLFFLYRENLESIIPNLSNCSIEEVKQLSYNYIEDNNFDDNYQNKVEILRKWHLKSILPSSLNSIIPSSLNITNWYDKAVWNGVDYDLLTEDLKELRHRLENNESNNQDLKKEIDEKQKILDTDKDLFCNFKIYSSKDSKFNFYLVSGEIKFEKINESQTNFLLNTKIEVYYNYLKEKFSIFQSNELLDSFVNNILEFVSKEIEKNLSLIAKQISQKYKS